jgi:hypothetical protein
VDTTPVRKLPNVVNHNTMSFEDTGPYFIDSIIPNSNKMRSYGNIISNKGMNSYKMPSKK